VQLPYLNLVLKDELSFTDTSHRSNSGSRSAYSFVANVCYSHHDLYSQN